MTNYEYIKAMPEKDLAKFLEMIAYDAEPWTAEFAAEFCKDCPTQTVTAEGYHQPLELNECDFADGECPHGDESLWWLKQEHKEGASCPSFT